jgi:hypothetical protein
MSVNRWNDPANHEEVDPVELASEDSFPASDPPAWVARPTSHRQPEPGPVPSDGALRPQTCRVIDLSAERVRRHRGTPLQRRVARISRQEAHIPLQEKAEQLGLSW